MHDYGLAVLLGVIEGLTEFLPVSSTAHLRITETLLGINLADEYGYQVMADHSLRSPHSAHMTVLARMGAPGFALCQLLILCRSGRRSSEDSPQRSQRAQRRQQKKKCGREAHPGRKSHPRVCVPRLE